MNEETAAGKLIGAIVNLGKRPVLFWCLLLAVNALALPYRGFHHDSRLYAAQVMERVEPGSFGPDLYLKYGSQDRFTIWTPLTAPVVGFLGLPLAYLVLFYLSKGLFFAAALRLVQRVVLDERAVVLSLLFLAMYQLPFGGQRIFHLNESFLTPRIVATALVMFSLERMLARCPVSAILLQVLALVVHPLMGLGGLTVYFFWGALLLLPGWRFVVFLLVCSVATAGMLLNESLTARFLGTMDEEWRIMTLQVCYFLRPSVWTIADWMRIVLAFTFGVLGATWGAPGRGPFLWAVTLAGAAGLIGTTVGVEMHYLLLIQISPYRTLWPLQLLCFPLVFLTIVKLWDTKAPLAKCASAALLLLVAPMDWEYEPNGLWLPVVSFSLFLLTGCLFGLLHAFGVASSAGPASDSPPWQAWLWKCAGVSFGLGFLYLCLYDLGIASFVITTPTDFYADMHPLFKLQVISLVLYKLPLLALIVLLAGWSLMRWPPAVFGTILILVTLAYHPLLAFGSQNAWYGEHYSTRYAHNRFVIDYIKDHSKPKPLVYWCTDLRMLWFEADALSYLNWVQLSGCGFDRGNALEGKRRSLLVKPFEIATQLQNPENDSDFIPLMMYYGMEVPPGQKPIQYLKTLPAATRSDLLDLSQEECLDFVVLEFNVDNLWCASSGRYFIYDCRELRLRFPQY